VEVESFAEIADEFAARIARLVWCTAATVDRHMRFARVWIRRQLERRQPG